MSFKIGKQLVGQNCEPYYIADIGANHDGNLDRAFELIYKAKIAGANAAKFQNFKANKIVSKFGFENLKNQNSHQKNWKKSVFEIYEEASISNEWTSKLKNECQKIGIEYFTSPYDFESIDHVDEFVNVYKIGSGDITWLEIIKYIKSKNKPILIATGASTLEDVERVMNIMDDKHDVCLMQCNTNYTLDTNKYKYVNLNVLNLYKFLYPNTLLGLSDHTIGHATVAGAIALGARVIEKHFTDDNNREGPDHKFAMNPESWRQMVDIGNEIFYSLGDGYKRIEENEIDSLLVQQRSIRAKHNLRKGQILTESDLEYLRPCPTDSLKPFQAKNILGNKLITDIQLGDTVNLKNIEL